MIKDDKFVRSRIKENKELILSQLKKTPIVQLACEKTGIGRATYYRWRKSDKRFKKNSDCALLEIKTFLPEKYSECDLINKLSALPGVEIPVKGFGASDCRNKCGGHLVYFKNYSKPEQILQLFKK